MRIQYKFEEGWGAAAEARETLKTSKYTELSETYCFTPTFGSWGSEGHKLVKKVIEETVEKNLLFPYFNQSR